ncbi:hypothetical protein [Dyadobacter luticola]|uniref:Uncharacterized protein n=1 Tax=Dyadobacter luticola TaxID=1979387 RepID=A0A5R9L5T0_9BACT|nr:hypothetical protein [Dyadobacter luticola]TLV03924.1 hypothetical protein FEN17_10160 [Dyadobacter luticola]
MNWDKFGKFHGTPFFISLRTKSREVALSPRSVFIKFMIGTWLGFKKGINVLLYELLLFIVAGTFVFMISKIAEWIEVKFPPKPKPPRPRRRREIKADLDVLYHSYQQGLLDEAAYLDQTDELIDQLAEITYRD